MKKFISLILSFIIASTSVLACNISYTNILSPQFDEVSFESEDLIATKKDDKFGYYNEKGEKVINFIYDVAMDFNEGKAIVKKGSETGFVRKDGKYTKLTSENTKITHKTMFYGGYVYIQSDMYGRIFDYSGREVIFDKVDGKEMYAIGSYGEGHFPVASAELKSDGSYKTDFVGFANSDGKIVYKSNKISELVNGNGIILTYIYPLDNGLAPANFDEYKNGEKISSNWGFIDKNGKIVVAPMYKSFRYNFNKGRYQVFSNGIASVQKHNELFGGIDKNGAVKIKFLYEHLETFSEGVAAAKNYSRKYFDYIDKDGKIVFDGQNSKILQATSFSDGIAVVQNDSAEIYAISTLCSNPYSKVIGSEKMLIDNFFSKNDTRSLSSSIKTFENSKQGVLKTNIISDKNIVFPVDNWATQEISLAVSNGIVPKKMQNSFKENISRQEFATLIVTMLETKLEKNIQEIVLEKTEKSLNHELNIFRDTADINIIAVNLIGIINGIGDNNFAPLDNITRQDAATILARTAEFLSINMPDTSSISYNDENSISNYAQDAVKIVSSLNVMNGTGSGKFSPKETYTVQQAIVTMLRIFLK